MDLAIEEGLKFTSWTPIEYKDISRFPARIKAAASALYNEVQRGEFNVIPAAMVVVISRNKSF